jgi:hypothetical protein
LASQSLAQIHSRLLVQQKTHLQNLQGITFFPMFFPWFFPSIAIFCGISTYLDLMSWNVLEPWSKASRPRCWFLTGCGDMEWPGDWDMGAGPRGFYQELWWYDPP